MRAVVQRVKESSVSVDGKIIGKIGAGLLVLIGIAKKDTISDIDFIADKILNLRIFEDENKKMNMSVLDIGGEILVVSQFTLLGDCRKGRRPSFIDAAEPEKANELYEKFVEKIRGRGVKVKTGIFRAMMDVSLVNDGPVTLIVES
ncbi:MAG: D-tyrosyl-tRNA(Tyr) deacylase [Proteobacteria bacterium]|nr:D-tyrosyl-tRNA(Tyr) deacylase [Pseudomonadota bacterium]